MLDKTTINEIELPAPQDMRRDDEPADLRPAVREHMAARGMSAKAVSQLAGMGESTFSAWLSGKYAGDHEKIEEKIRIWLNSEKSFARKKALLTMDTNFVFTRTAKKFLGVLEHAQAMGDLVVIAGGAGTGKTAAIKQHKSAHPNVWHLTAEPLLSSSRKIMEYLRETVGVAETASFRMSQAVSAKIINSQGLIVIDEAQHLNATAIEQLRSVHDRAGVGMAFVGNEEVWRRIDGGGRKAEFAQLFSRVGMRVTVAKLLPKDTDEILDASEITDVKQRAILKTIAAKPGALRQMKKVLNTARTLAAGGGEVLGEAHIMSAWNRLSGGEGGVA